VYEHDRDGHPDARLARVIPSSHEPAPPRWPEPIFAAPLQFTRDIEHNAGIEAIETVDGSVIWLGRPPSTTR
jgi:hypothetical protein